jgi:hypothetical protein
MPAPNSKTDTAIRKHLRRLHEKHGAIIEARIVVRDLDGEYASERVRVHFHMTANISSRHPRRQKLEEQLERDGITSLPIGEFTKRIQAIYDQPVASGMGRTLDVALETLKDIP